MFVLGQCEIRCWRHCGAVFSRLVMVVLTRNCCQNSNSGGLAPSRVSNQLPNYSAMTDITQDQMRARVNRSPLYCSRAATSEALKVSKSKATRGYASGRQLSFVGVCISEFACCRSNIGNEDSTVLDRQYLAKISYTSNPDYMDTIDRNTSLATTHVINSCVVCLEFTHS